jgi:hypothetical protein
LLQALGVDKNGQAGKTDYPQLTGPALYGLHLTWDKEVERQGFKEAMHPA